MPWQLPVRCTNARGRPRASGLESIALLSPSESRAFLASGIHACERACAVGVGLPRWCGLSPPVAQPVTDAQHCLVPGLLLVPSASAGGAGSHSRLLGGRTSERRGISRGAKWCCRIPLVHVVRTAVPEKPLLSTSARGERASHSPSVAGSIPARRPTRSAAVSLLQPSAVHRSWCYQAGRGAGAARR